MGQFDNLDTAVRVREVIKRIAKRTVQVDAPGVTVARVVHVDVAAMRAFVWIAGDPQPVPAKLTQGAIPAAWYKRSAPSGNSNLPSTSTEGFGSMVVLQRYQNQLYVVDVLSGGEFAADLQALNVANVEQKPYSFPFGSSTPVASNEDPVGSAVWSRLAVRVKGTSAISPGSGVVFGPFVGELNTGLINMSIVQGNYQKTYRFVLQRLAYDLESGTPKLEKWFRIIPESEQFEDDNELIDWDLDVGFRVTDFTRDPSGVRRTAVWFRMVNSSNEDYAINARVTVDSGAFYTAHGTDGRFVCQDLLNVTEPAGYLGAYGGNSPLTELPSRFAIDSFPSTGILNNSTADTGEVWSEPTGNWRKIAEGPPVTVRVYLTDAPQLQLATITPNLAIGNLAEIDTSMLVDSVGDFSVGAEMCVGPIWRVSGGNGYTAHIVYHTNGTVGWAIRSFSGSAVITLAEGLTEYTIGNHFFPNNFFGIRVRHGADNIIYLKVWDDEVESESDVGWINIHSDTYTSPGAMGFSVYQPIGGSNHAFLQSGQVTRLNRFIKHWRGGYIGSAVIQKSREISHGPWRNPRLRLANDIQKTAYSTGRFSIEENGVTWGDGESIVLGGVGRHRAGLAGGTAYCTFPLPGAQIPIYPSGTVSTVTAGIIPMDPGQALWLGVPPGIGNEELHEYLFIVDETQVNLNFGVPEWAVFLCARPTGTESVLIVGVQQPDAPTPPFAQFTQHEPQAIGSSYEPIVFAREIIDSHNGHSNNVNPSRYYFVEPGWYEVNGKVYVSGVASGERLVCCWALNGAFVEGGQAENNGGSSGGYTSVTAQPLFIQAAAGDYLELWALHTGSGDRYTFVSGDRRDASMMNLKHFARPLTFADSAPVPPPAPETGSGCFLPAESRSWRPSGWRTDNVYVYGGQWTDSGGSYGNHKGVFFYGNQFSGLGTITVTSATIRLKRRSAGGWTAPQQMTLALYAEKTKPSGQPTVLATTPGPALGWGQEDAAFPIPVSWAQQIVNGTAGGIGLFESDALPYVILEGKATYSLAGQLCMNWNFPNMPPAVLGAGQVADTLLLSDQPYLIDLLDYEPNLQIGDFVLMFVAVQSINTPSVDISWDDANLHEMSGSPWVSLVSFSSYDKIFVLWKVYDGVHDITFSFSPEQNGQVWKATVVRMRNVDGTNPIVDEDSGSILITGGTLEHGADVELPDLSVTAGEGDIVLYYWGNPTQYLASYWAAPPVPHVTIDSPSSEFTEFPIDFKSASHHAYQLFVSPRDSAGIVNISSTHHSGHDDGSGIGESTSIRCIVGAVTLRKG